MVKGVVKIWTDGSCNNETNNKGGYGVVMTFLNYRQELWGGSFYNTTSQRMELMAAITALETVKLGYQIYLHCDAQYISNAINQKWAFKWESQDFKNRPNSDLWKRLLKAYRRFPKGHVDIIWTRGHNGDLENERADELARIGSKHLKLEQDLDEVKK